MSTETLTTPELALDHEVAAVQSALSIVGAELSGQDQAQFDSLVRIVGQFSRSNPDTGEYETISPSRIASIPAITARHMDLVRPARGELSLEQIERDWVENIPARRDGRHPDHLFDIAQNNFGHDQPLMYVQRNIMAAELARQELIARYRSTLRSLFTQYRYERPLDDDATEAMLDSFADHLPRG